MGDLNVASKKPKELHVLVSGAGPFREHTRNPANLIAAGLPAKLSGSTTAGSSHPDITLHSTPTPWQVSYSWVNEQIPPMLFSTEPDSSIRSSSSGTVAAEQQKSRPNYDIICFIGMANTRTWYSLERQAHRDGYRFPDNEGRTAEDDDHWIRHGSPETLSTTFDPDRVLDNWQNNVAIKDIDLRISDDAGRYLCDYIYYTGLYEYWLHCGKDRGESRPVVFLHVPGEADDAAVEKGVAVTSGLIMAIAADLMAKH